MTRQLSFGFMTPKCWLVCEDRVRGFHYVIEGELRRVDQDGKAVVHVPDREKIITLPAKKVYPTREAAVQRRNLCNLQLRAQ
jgi:hypothetical protein